MKLKMRTPALFFFFVVISIVVSAVEARTVIQDIALSGTDDAQTLQISIDGNRTPITLLDSGSGWIRIEIKNSIYVQNKKYSELGSRVISGIKLFQIEEDVLFEIHFNDIFFTPEANQMDLTTTKSNITLRVASKIPKPSKEKTPNQTVAQKFADATVDAAPNGSTANAVVPVDLTPPLNADSSTDISPVEMMAFDYDFKSNALNMLYGLLALLTVGYFILYLLNRFGFKKFKINHNKYSINVLATKLLAPKQKILIIDINDKKFACGVTKDHINYLTHIPDEMESEFNRLMKEPQMTVPALRTIFLKRRKERNKKNNPQQSALTPNINQPDNAEGQKKTSHSRFHDEFLGKIKNLKKMK